MGFLNKVINYFSITKLQLHNLLCLGTGRSDFKPQLEGPNAFDLKKYTFIAIELPGWGRSRPPARPYGMDVYQNDTECALKLMEV